MGCRQNKQQVGEPTRRPARQRFETPQSERRTDHVPLLGASTQLECGACGGRGTLTGVGTCDFCRGSGQGPRPPGPAKTGMQWVNTPCDACGGVGALQGVGTCPFCDGDKFRWHEMPVINADDQLGRVLTPVATMSCTKCLAAFSRQSALDRHMSTVHADCCDVDYYPRYWVHGGAQPHPAGIAEGSEIKAWLAEMEADHGERKTFRPGSRALYYSEKKSAWYECAILGSDASGNVRVDINSHERTVPRDKLATHLKPGGADDKTEDIRLLAEIKGSLKQQIKDGKSIDDIVTACEPRVQAQAREYLEALQTARLSYVGSFSHPSFESLMQIYVIFYTAAEGIWTANGKTDKIAVSRDGEKIWVADSSTEFDGEEIDGGILTGVVVHNSTRGGTFELRPEVRCNTGHHLRRYGNAFGFSCDFCCERVSLHSRLFVCQSCDVDICERCLRKAAFDVGAQAMYFDESQGAWYLCTVRGSNESGDIHIDVEGHHGTVHQGKVASHLKSFESFSDFFGVTFTSDSCKHTIESIFDQMFILEPSMLPGFKALAKSTYLEICTRDRRCPRDRSCASYPMIGGCECVNTHMKGPHQSPGMPLAYRIIKAVRVEDSSMWDRYVAHRASIVARRGTKLEEEHFASSVLTTETVGEHPGLFAPLQEKANEIYLFHGTSVRSALKIAQDDISLDLASTGGALGPGFYLTESITKADEYGKDEPGGYYDNIFAVIIFRVALGKPYVILEFDSAAGDHVKSGEFDSVIGDRAEGTGSFREFVIYNEDQAYPEYILFYQRLYKDPSFRAPGVSPMQFQVPIYWANCHLDPRTERFRKEYPCRKSTLELMQKVLTAMFEEGNDNIELVSAVRIEDSEMWMTYDRCKTALAEKHGLSDGQRCVPPQHLDGDESRGRALISEILLECEPEAALSLENLSFDLNELMLFHGTSKFVAQEIARTGFKINRKSTSTRFGQGAYFAENVYKSLSYAEESDGKSYLLLCRVLCGQLYYTEKEHEHDASNKAEAANMDGTLSNPRGHGPREFVVFKESQIYPEFLLEVVRTHSAINIDASLPNQNVSSVSTSTATLTQLDGETAVNDAAADLADAGHPYANASRVHPCSTPI